MYLRPGGTQDQKESTSMFTLQTTNHIRTRISLGRIVAVLAVVGLVGVTPATALGAAPPAISSIGPQYDKPGFVVTVNGTGFGATQQKGYVRLTDGTNVFGGPKGAPLQVDSWKAAKIAFTLPVPGGPTGAWRLVPGTTAKLTVTQNGATTKVKTLAIGNSDNPADYYGNIGISPDNHRTCGANFDVGTEDDAFSANLLAKDGITPGGTVKAGGLTFMWPDPANCYYDNIIATGQTILMHPAHRTTALGFLGASANASRSGTLVIHYTDGSRSKRTIAMSDWGVPALPGNTVVARMKYRNTRKGPETKAGFSIFLLKVPVTSSKTVASIQLPSTVFGNQSMRIFALALNGTPVAEKPVVGSLSSNTGPAAGGTKLIITGDNFASATAIHFGTVRAGSFTVMSPNTIGVTTPANTGAVDVTVTGPGGTSVMSIGDKFTYK